MKYIDPGAFILIMTNFSDEGQIVAAINVGAEGYVFKDASPDELIHAIHGAPRGNLDLPEQMLQIVQSGQPVDGSKS